MEVVDVMLNQHGVDLNATETRANGAFTPLHCAAFDGLYEIAEKLLKSGANPNCQDALGRTSLIVAVVKGNYQLSKLLVDFGSNSGIADFTGRTALDYALDKKLEDIAALFSPKKPTPSAGQTPLPKPRISVSIY
jgi:ankyrin repeat protein